MREPQCDPSPSVEGGWFEETLWPDWAQRMRITRVLYREQTAHQDLILFETPSWGRVLALDGVVQTTTGDERVYHEMLVHTPIMAHGRVERVLVIGGGDGGCLREIVKHPVTAITQVEIDPGVVTFCRAWLPSLSDGAFDDPRVELVIADGAAFVRDAVAAWDVIIVDSTDPHGPGAVLFTEAFYRHCRARLRPGGILVTQSGNPAIAPDELLTTQARKRAAGFAHVSCFFAPVPTYIGGSMALGFASDAAGPLAATLADLTRGPLPERLEHYTPEVHLAAFARPAWLGRRLPE